MIQIVQSRVGAGFENNETFLNYYQYTEQGVDLALLECGYEKCDPNHYWMGRKGFHIIHIILSGKGTLEIGGRRYKLQAGEGFYIGPDQQAKYTADEEDPWEYRWVGFLGTRAVIAMNLTDIPSLIVFRMSDVEKVDEQLKEIYEAASMRTEQGEMRAIGTLHYFLADLVDEHREEDRQPSVCSELVTLATALVRENYSHSFCVEDICKGVNVSRSYLYKLFMRYYRMSPSDYLLKYRLEKAREILASQNCPINVVAEMVGFSSHAYFTKRFRMAYNITPKAYVRSLRKEWKRGEE